MADVETLLRAFIADYRATGRPHARRYLDEVTGTDRLELEAYIEQFLADEAERPFDPEAFARFRADPARAAMVERIVDDATLEQLRREAGVSKARIATVLAEKLGLPGRERPVKARYHDLERGAVDPDRVRRPVWEALAELFGERVERVRDAALAGFGGAADTGPPPVAAFARVDVISPVAGPVRGADDESDVDRAFFED